MYGVLTQWWTRAIYHSKVVLGFTKKDRQRQKQRAVKRISAVEEVEGLSAGCKAWFSDL